VSSTQRGGVFAPKQVSRAGVGGAPRAALSSMFLLDFSPWTLPTGIRIYKYCYASKSYEEQTAIFFCSHSPERLYFLSENCYTFHHDEDQIYGIFSRSASVAIRKSYR
jgi:hypothetical protein